MPHRGEYSFVSKLGRSFICSHLIDGDNSRDDFVCFELRPFPHSFLVKVFVEIREGHQTFLSLGFFFLAEAEADLDFLARIAPAALLE